jgi:hypothetical protein
MVQADLQSQLVLGTAIIWRLILIAPFAQVKIQTATNGRGHLLTGQY